MFATGLSLPGRLHLTEDDYGTASAPDDRLSRITLIIDGSTALAAYTYLGTSSVIRIDYTEPGVRLYLWAAPAARSTASTAWVGLPTSAG